MGKKLNKLRNQISIFEIMKSKMGYLESLQRRLILQWRQIRQTKNFPKYRMTYILWYSVEYKSPMYRSLESCDNVWPAAHFSSTTSKAACTRYCNSSSLSKSDVAIYCGEFWNFQMEMECKWTFDLLWCLKKQ